MIEHVLLGIEEGPEDVFEDLLGFCWGGGEGVGDGFGFFGGGFAGEAARVEGIEDGERRGGGVEEFFDDVAFADAGLGDVAVEEVEGLAEVGVHFDFAGADGGAFCAAEGAEEVGGDVAVGDLDGAGAEGEALEFVSGFGDLADGVEHDLGALAADEGVAEVFLVVGVAVVDAAAELIGAAGADVADELAEVVIVLGEFGAEGGEEFRVAGWVGDADIVGWVDDTDAEEVGPDDVGEIGGEVGIAGGGHPVDEDGAAVFAGGVWFFSAEEFGLVCGRPG